MARRFNGTDQDAQVAVNLSAYTKIALSVWFYWDAFANNDAILIDYGVGSSAGGFTIDPNGSDGLFWVLVYDVGGAQLNSYKFTRPSAKAWHHLLVNIDRAAASAGQNAVTDLWLDGATVSPSGGSGDLVDNFGNLTFNINARTNSSNFGAGRTAELAVWQSIRFTAADAADLWNSGAGTYATNVQSASLIYYAPMCGFTSPELPAVGTATMTLNGATTPPQAPHPITGDLICGQARRGGAALHGNSARDSVVIAASGTNSDPFSMPDQALGVYFRIPILSNSATLKLQALQPKLGDRDADVWADLSTILTDNAGAARLSTVSGLGSVTAITQYGFDAGVLGAGVFRFVSSASLTGGAVTIDIVWRVSRQRISSYRSAYRSYQGAVISG